MFFKKGLLVSEMICYVLNGALNSKHCLLISGKGKQYCVTIVC